jgi:hypothetical protein
MLFATSTRTNSTGPEAVKSVTLIVSAMMPALPLLCESPWIHPFGFFPLAAAAQDEAAGEAKNR